MKTSVTVAVLLAGVVLAGGCDKKPAPAAGGSAGTGTSATAAAAFPQGLILTSKPEGAKTVEDQKAVAKVGDTVAISGRVGGSTEPFVEDRAVLVLMGPGLKACSDNPGDECKKPWDYCCETPTERAKHSATVRVVGADGKPVKFGLKGQGGMKELSSLVVVGKVSQVDEEGTMVVDATGIYVEKP